MTGELVSWLLALAPVIAMLGLFVWLDTFKLMTMCEILVLLSLGALAAGVAYPISGRLIDALPLGFSFYSRVAAPWVEEALKGSTIILLFAFNRVGFKLDAVISGFAVGAGFSVVENILYLQRFTALDISVWMVRGLGTAVMHGLTLAVLAAIAHELAERATRAQASEFRLRLRWFVPGYLAAVAIHSLFNQFPDRPLVAMLGALVAAPFTVMALFRFGALEAEQWLVAERAAHADALDRLRRGEWPDDPAAVRLGQLASRADGSLVRTFYECQLELAVLAETLLGAQAFTDEKLHADVADAFARADRAEAALGPSLAAAAKRLLPLSRNDLWEISELRQRLTKKVGSGGGT